jgi:hypothetical protein
MVGLMQHVFNWPGTAAAAAAAANFAQHQQSTASAAAGSRGLLTSRRYGHMLQVRGGERGGFRQPPQPAAACW